MKKLSFFALLAGALVHQVTAAVPVDVSLKVTPERDLVYRNGNREVVVQVDLVGRTPERGKRSPMNLAVVMDRSGSMSGAKIEKARQAACVALDQLGTDDYFSLVVYDNNADVVISPTKVRDEDQRATLKAKIERISPGGSTALYDGVKLGSRQLQDHLDREFVNRVILLSDGIANVGPSSTNDLVKLGRDLREDGMSVSTIGLGDDYNEDLMTALAESSNANYYYVKDAEKLPGIFSEELGSTRSMIARGINIRITVPNGVILKEIIGRPEIECKDREALIKLPEYFGGEKRRFLARCVVEEGKAEAIELASVAMDYDQADGKRADKQSQAANIKFTDEKDKADESLKVEVARELAVMDNRLAKEKAVKYADEGNVKAAAGILREQKAKNAALPASVASPNITKDNDGLDTFAAELESGGKLEKSSRKRLQYENWQDKYQKR